MTLNEKAHKIADIIIKILTSKRWMLRLEICGIIIIFCSCFWFLNHMNQAFYMFWAANYREIVIVASVSISLFYSRALTFKIKQSSKDIIDFKEEIRYFSREFAQKMTHHSELLKKVDASNDRHRDDHAEIVHNLKSVSERFFEETKKLTVANNRVADDVQNYASKSEIKYTEIELRVSGLEELQKKLTKLNDFSID